MYKKIIEYLIRKYMETGYKKAIGIWYPSELKSIKKQKEKPLAPLFEAFVNSLESILINKKNDDKIKDNGKITIELFLTKKDLHSNAKFQKITIEDSGIGFNDTEFERFINLRDDRKPFSNKGLGRIQFVHFFDKTLISSVYRDNKSHTGYKKREIILSKNQEFLKQNSIIRLDSEEEIKATESSTVLTFETLLDEKDVNFYSELNSEKIKSEFIQHFLVKFCENKNTLPKIIINTIIDDEKKESISITSEDIPEFHIEKDIKVNYSKLNEKKIEKTINAETFNLKSFLISKNELDKNELKLVSKGETSKRIKLNCLLPDDIINGGRYLFLLSGNYIDNMDGDSRGDIDIISRKEFKEKNKEIFESEEEILIEDIEEIANTNIISLHKEIEEKNQEKEKNIKELERMFLLNPQTVESLRKKIKINDSDELILSSIYEADAKIIAEKDAKIKKILKDIESLTPDNENYQNLLNTKVNEFVKTIPLQNRTSLSQYVARRKIVLDLFQKVLDKELENLKNNGRIDENLMHNLIFQQSSDNTEDSDLWLIGEEYIHFKGFSNKELKNATINGIKIFNKDFSKEEERYLNSLGEKRIRKKPDILLFPEEGKCIIIELKAPDVNVSDYMTQIDKYANLIRNYTIDDIQIVSFYGYLIGEAIEDRDVRSIVGPWEHSSHLKYWFRPSQNVHGFDGRSNGSIYTEVIKYSTLLERAKLRNKIFIEKLEKE